MDLIKKAADSNPTDPRVRAAIDVKILDILEVDESDIATPAEQAEIQQQLMTGESNEEIIQDNPGTTVTDIEAAAAAAARDN